MVLLFRPGSRVKPEKWACPRAKESDVGCRKRFWSDGELRRSNRLPEDRREFKQTKDTFACRFYQRLANNSPCEAVVAVDVSVRLFDHDDRPMPGALFLARFLGREQRGAANGSGFILLKGVLPPVNVHLQWREQTDFDDEDPDERLFLYRRDLFVPLDNFNDKNVEQRLHNLGFTSAATLEDNIKAFQRYYDLPETGKTKDVAPILMAVHDATAVKPFEPENTGAAINNNP